MTLVMQPSVHRPSFRYYAVTLEDMLMSDDEKHVRAVFDKLMNAWNNADATAFASCFTEDSDYITYSGQHIEGREATRKVHEKFFKSFLKDTVLSGDIQKVKFVSTDVAVVHSVAGVSSRWRPAFLKNKINTTVLVRQQGEWKISDFQNSKIEKKGITERLKKIFW
ncbi:SgcJ/EcaC family oxidoreductase [Foetidibacter luteolus]|uniref:SgcJ/EcaC family oxidoreductase n=1 Tax=Foetidibacter luteolus TaxID=2608880 RepID=UPI00129BF5D0|nr:SgcJ/EcaC family oxidoreductase [Foetidibacter luteolus]